MIRNVAIVSLSSGIIGEPFIQFEVEIGLRRLKELGLNVKFMPRCIVPFGVNAVVDADKQTIRFVD